MLNARTEKQDTERLIIKDEVSMKSTITSPFESTDDIVFSGNFSTLGNNKVTFRTQDTRHFMGKQDDFIISLKEDQIKNAKKDLRRNPKNPFLLNNLGLAYLSSGDPHKALSSFKKAVEVKKDFTTAKINLAIAYSLKKEEKLALEVYKELLKRNPRDIRVLMNIGDSYFKSKEIEKAKEIFIKIIKLDAKNIGARNRLAITNIIQGHPGKAINELRRCLEVNVELPSIYNNLGASYGIIGSYKKAILSFKTALKLAPNYASAISNLATTLYLMKRYQDAIELLEDYLINNKGVQIRELLSRLYMDNKQYQKALKNLKLAFSDAIRLEFPKQEIARLHNNIGVIYFNSGDFKSAEENFKASIEKAGYINQAPIQNILDLYFIYNKLNRVKEYIDILGEKFSGDGFYWYYSGLYEFFNNEPTRAIEHLQSFLKINKGFAPSYSFLGFIYAEYMNNHTKAIETCKEGLNIFPNSVPIINNLAYSYLMNNELDNAEKILEKAREINTNVYLTATRGLLEIKRGNLERGRIQYNSAADLAKNEHVRNLVMQKKYLELGRYYLENNNKNAAKSNLLKVLSIKLKDSVYTLNAGEMYKKLDL